MADKTAFAYLAIKKEAVGKGACATGSKKYVHDVVERWRSGEAPQKETDQVVEPELPLETTQEKTLHDALNKAVAFALSQTHLIEVTNLAPTVFEQASFFLDILEPVKEACESIEDDDTATIYALDQDHYAKIDKAMKRLSDFHLGVAALPGAALMSLVASFDALIVDLLAKMLRLDRTWMSKGERRLSYARLAQAENLDELISEAIREDLYQFSRGSHDEQAKYIESNFGISIRSSWRRWPDYIEVFERRNLIAHGETRFNDRYVSICDAAGHKGSDKLLNEKVELRMPYLRQSLDILTEFALLLPFSVWRKVSDEEEEKAFTQLNEAAYSLIQNGRYVAAERVLEFALTLTKVKVPVNLIQMLTINRASALRHAGSKDQSDAVLDGVDWSASSDLFQICMHSVRGNADKVAELIPTLVAAEKLSAATFKQWPCFSFVREAESVLEAFEKTFGEPLTVPARQTTTADDEVQETTEETIH